MEMIEIQVPVIFTGNIIVKVPHCLMPAKQKELAEITAKCLLVADTRSADCEESLKSLELACEKFVDHPFATEDHFRAAHVSGNVVGKWNIKKD